MSHDAPLKHSEVEKHDPIGHIRFVDIFQESRWPKSLKETSFEPTNSLSPTLPGEPGNSSILPKLSLTGLAGSTETDSDSVHLAAPPPNSNERPLQTLEQFPDRVANLQWQSSAARDQSDCSSVVTANMIYLATGNRPSIDDILSFDKSVNNGDVHADGSADPAGREDILEHWGLSPTDYHNASVAELAELVEEGKVTSVAVNSSILRSGGNDGNGLDHVVNVLGVNVDGKGNVIGFTIVDTGVSAKPETVTLDRMKAATFNSTDIETVNVNGGPGSTTAPLPADSVPSESSTSNPSSTNSAQSDSFQGTASGSDSASSSESFAPQINGGSGSDGTGGSDNGTNSGGVTDTTPDPHFQAYNEILNDTGSTSIPQSTLRSWLGMFAGLTLPLTPEEIEQLEKEGIPAGLINDLEKNPQLLQQLQSQSFQSWVNSSAFTSLGNIGDPNAYFLSQIGTMKSNPNGDSKGNEDCGPTSLVMALRHFGKMSLDPQDAAQEIDEVRNAMGKTSHLIGTGNNDIITAAKKFGVQATEVDGVQSIENALSQGKQVIATGNPIYYENEGVYQGSSYDQAVKLTGATYGNNAQFSGDHYIDVVGRTSDGKFIVNDPLDRDGTFAITEKELEQYLNVSSSGGSGGSGVAIGP